MNLKYSNYLKIVGGSYKIDYHFLRRIIKEAEGKLNKLFNDFIYEYIINEFHRFKECLKIYFNFNDYAAIIIFVLAVENSSNLGVSTIIKEVSVVVVLVLILLVRLLLRILVKFSAVKSRWYWFFFRN